MTTDLKKCIDTQLAFNQSKNLFHRDAAEFLKLTDAIVNAIQNIGQMAPTDLNVLIHYTVDKVLQELCRVNQYYSFQKNDIRHLKAIYNEVYQNLLKGEYSVEIISQMHYQNVKEWLETANPFSRETYQNREAVLEPVTCSEYSAALQNNILHLSDLPLLEPILDIGCGKTGHLVNYLRRNGFEAYGIDRFAEDSSFISRADWLTYEYGQEKWGAIVSNLGFSNHFINHHLREDGNYLGYAASYMEILRSLKPGGCFCYAPDLPFLEPYLDQTAFSIKKYNIENIAFKTTIVTKLLS